MALWQIITPLAIVQIDATPSEKISEGGEITKHPIEVGADVTDHFRPLPARLSLDAYLTDTPIAIQSGGVPVSFPGQAMLNYNTLKSCKDAGLFVSVVASTQTYDNMLITSIEKNTDNKSLDGTVHITLALEQVFIVDSLTVSTQNGATNAAKQKQALNKKTGVVQGNVTDSNQTPLTRLATGAFNAFKGLFP